MIAAAAAQLRARWLAGPLRALVGALGARSTGVPIRLLGDLVVMDRSCWGPTPSGRVCGLVYIVAESPAVPGRPLLGG